MKNVVTLSSATLITQAIGILSIPILARIYTPDHFGQLYSFIGTLQILVLISTLKLEKAIVLTKEKAESAKLLIFTISFLLLFSVFVFTILLFFRLVEYEPAFLELEYLFLIPIAIVSFAAFSSFLNWFQRNEQYKVMSKLIIAQGLLTFLISAILGFVLKNSMGLILGYVLGTLLVLTSVFFFNISNQNSVISIFKSLKPKSILKKYWKFPLYYVPFTIFTRGITFLTPILFISYFGDTDTGFYSLSLKVVMVPVVIILFGISNVFLINANKEYLRSGNFQRVFLQNFLFLLPLTIVVYGTIYFLSDFLFPLFLGEEWNEIIPFVKLLSIIVAFDFLSQTFKNNVFIITGQQNVGTIIQGLYAVTIVGMIYIFKETSILEILNVHILITAFFAMLIMVIAFIYSKGYLLSFGGLKKYKVDSETE
ncbi:MAG: O-antigen/teichoic acid export membrane protein [Maribacter sp.]